jgi:hypothetical protein
MFNLFSRVGLRAGWRTLILLVVVLGIGYGTALASFAGARRTDDAVGQFVTYSRPDTGGFLSGSVSAPPLTPGRPASSMLPDPVAQRVLALPQVTSWSRAPFLYLTTDPSGDSPLTLTAIGVADAALFRSMDRPLVLAGRLPPPSEPSEATVNEFAARARHLRVGSRLHLYAYSYEQSQSGSLTGAADRGPQAPAGPSYTVRVAAIIRSPQEVDAVRALADRQGVPFESQQGVYLTPAFVRQYAAGLGIPVSQVPDINLLSVRLRHGQADWPSFASAAQGIAGNAIFLSAGNTYSVHKAAASAQRGIHLVVVALLAFGALVALLTLVFVGQVLARQVAQDAEDFATMRAIGATPRQIVALASLRPIVVGVTGAALAIAAAWLASPIMPIGLARQAEIRPGLSFDPLILVLGGLVLALLLLPWAALPAWRLARTPVVAIGEPPTDRHPSRVNDVLARSSAPPATSVGVRFGLERDGRSGAVTAVLAAAVAIGAIAASVTFGSSLNGLEHIPRQQGWNWDVLVGNPSNFVDTEDSYARILAHDHFVSGYSAIAILAGGNQGNAAVDGHLVNLLLAFDPLKGSVGPPLLQGHAPHAPDQIVLATKSMAQLHKHIGQSVQVGGPEGQPITLRIVGTMIAPSVGDLFPNGMGEGAWVYGPAVRAAEQQGGASQGQGAAPPTVFNEFAVRLVPGTSVGAALRALRQQFGPVVLRQLPSQDVINLQSVERLPLLIALLVMVLGAATLGNSLVATVRRRRREIGVLKTIGFLRSQVAGAVAWQATLFASLALVVGLPVGIAVGRWSWTLVATGIGSAAPPVVPALWVALLVPLTLLLANVIAAGPAWAAARLAPAAAIRSE